MGLLRRDCLFALLVLLVSSQATLLAAPGSGGRRMLVGFRPDKGPKTANARAEAVRRHGGGVHGAFDVIPVVCADLPEQAIEKLRAQPEVEYVEEDVLLYAIGQTKPWGVDRIDADLAWPTGNIGQGVKVAVLDTGIDYDHPDLRLAGGVNFAGTSMDGNVNRAVWDDKHGHGTHVAGIVAARNNTIGVVGVAPGVNLWAVKVLGDNGSGYTSDIIQGLDWCAANGVRVASMSLGGGSTTSLKNACDRAYARGVVLVAAAGNSGGAVEYPAAYSSVIAVSATDSGNGRAWFSSYGSQIELAAPGVSIPSTYKNGTYATMSGTSMACPHVVGAAALAWASGLTSHTAVRSRLRTTAEDLGVRGFDTTFGYGLVDAQKAAKYTVAGDEEEAPGVQITQPQDGAVVSGTVIVTAATDGDAAVEVEFFVDEASVGVDADGNDGWSGTWDTTTSPDGEYMLTAVTTDAAGQTQTHSIRIKVENAVPSAAKTASVRTIEYATEGSKQNNTALLITLRVEDNLENPVPNASVLAGVFVNGKLRWTLSGTTDAEGALTLRIDKPRRGLYQTTIADLQAEGLTWDAQTPPNEFMR